MSSYSAEIGQPMQEPMHSMFNYGEDDEEYSYSDLILDVTCNDDKPYLLRMLKNKFEVFRGEIRKTEEMRSHFRQAILFNSPKCASVLLEGELHGLKLDLNAPLPNNTYYIHLAAQEYNHELLDLMLQHGASADLRTFGRDPHDGNDLLPLNVALDNLSCHSYLVDWTPEDSVFKLITLLCLPQMSPVLNSIRLLATHTTDTFVEFCKYAKEGYIIQMAVLLIAARDHIKRGPTTATSEGGCINGLMWLRNQLPQEIGLLFIEEHTMRSNGKSAKEIKKRRDARTAMVSAFRLLEVFERAGDAIDAFLEEHRNTRVWYPIFYSPRVDLCGFIFA